ncbi:MAG TPA: hypothetical protein VND19_00895 [Acetobacteraceae bacterium]|nr:hypothetical protein [Acetobacteraceae bacterium]
MSAIRTVSIGFGVAAMIGVGLFSSPARADRDDWHHGWHDRGWYHRWGPPAVVVAPRPYYYAPPPVYYAPPPVVYAPPPPYYAPGVSFGFTVR